MIEQKFGIEILPTWHGKQDRSAQVYCSSVRAELEQIFRSQAGLALANSLRFHKKKILVMPYENQDCNAQEDGVTPGSTQSVVLFSPYLLANTPCAKSKSDVNNATLPHERLYHELVHAFRRTSGYMNRRRLTGALSVYTNSEEFLAILATNIFISDASNLAKTGLRGGHEGHVALDKEYSGSYAFFRYGTRAYYLVTDFCKENRGFTQMLARIRAPFNPLAGYYKNRRKAFEMAVAGDAEAVFISMTPMDYYQEPATGVWTRIGRFPSPELPKKQVP